ncbi:DUF3265 domain-containing protein [Vibrio parahaemolyticus]|nr:DUF3265 domain-containing protein [Vibrio parahaemolyticus]
MVITKRLRGTWHAWHFQFALGLVVKVLCGHFCIACLRPLTRRYNTEYPTFSRHFTKLDLGSN